MDHSFSLLSVGYYFSLFGIIHLTIFYVRSYGNMVLVRSDT